MDLLERVAATGLLEPARPVVVLVSGGRDSVCLLDVAVTLSGADAVRALHVNYGLREAADADEAHCVALGERLGVPVEIHRAARPDDATGNLQAWARDVRYGAAARRDRRRRRRARRRCAHRDRSGRDDPLPPRRVAGPPRAPRHAGAVGSPRAAAARHHARGDRGVVPRARPRMARGRHEHDGPLRARARAGRPRAGPARGASTRAYAFFLLWVTWGPNQGRSTRIRCAVTRFG